MREFFSQFGKVIDSTVMLDRETGRSKGFGFVSFEDTNVQPFLGFGNLQIDGKLVGFDVVLAMTVVDFATFQIDVKLAQPRYQRDYFQEDGVQQQPQQFGGGPRAGAGGNGVVAGGGFSPQTGGAGVNFPAVQANTAGMPGAPAGNTPFDPQALAQLYTRMFQMAGAGGMLGGMGMSPMIGNMGGGMGGGGYGGGGMGGMGRGMGGGMGGGPGGPGMGGGMGRGGQGMVQGGTPTGPSGLGPNVPRGPRGAQGGAGGPGGPGPQRASQRGQHSYHPYGR